MTDSQDFGFEDNSHPKRLVASVAPTTCATMNPGASWGRIPAKVFVKERAMVTAGFANDVDAVNQYAAVMYAPTANGTASDRRLEHPQITPMRPNVAVTSLSSCGAPLRTWVDHANNGSPNIEFASATPAIAPAHCTNT